MEPTQFVMTDKANGIRREQFYAAGWTDEQLVEYGFMRARNPNGEYGAMHYRFTSEEGVNVVYGSRSSIDPHADSLLVDKAFMFRDAAERDGRVFVCALVQPWQARVMRWLGVRL
jgi:hypothetical protein